MKKLRILKSKTTLLMFVIGLVLLATVSTAWAAAMSREDMFVLDCLANGHPWDFCVWTMDYFCSGGHCEY